MATPPTLEAVRAAMHRLFIDDPAASLRKEDEQKCRELTGVLARLAKLRAGAHLVDAAAGKAGVGLVAAELLPVGRVTVVERRASRVAACEAAATRLRREVRVEVRRGDVADQRLWPEQADAVVGLHACGGATDRILEGAIASRARWLFVAPCCYDEGVVAAVRARAAVSPWLEAADEPLRRRVLCALVDVERALRLEAAGFETHVEEFVAPTVTPHNLLLCARRTGSAARMARAAERLAGLSPQPC